MDSHSPAITDRMSTKIEQNVRNIAMGLVGTTVCTIFA